MCRVQQLVVLTWTHQLVAGSRDRQLAKRCLDVLIDYRRGNCDVGVTSGSAFDTTVHAVNFTLYVVTHAYTVVA